MKFLALVALITATFQVIAEEPESATMTALKAALAHERRGEADLERDDNRKPLETLSFFRLEKDMEVLELLPGSGWYTRILGPVLEEEGKLYLSIGTGRMSTFLEDEPEGFGSTEVIPFDGIIRSESETRRYTMPELGFGVRKLDLILTFRNLHNFDGAGRANMNEAAFKALKSGGLYGVVDHTRRHMQPDGSEVWRRMDPVLAVQEIQAAGFRLVDFSDLHYRPDDELRYEVGRKSVTGNTDRFTLLFEKP